MASGWFWDRSSTWQRQIWKCLPCSWKEN